VLAGIYLLELILGRSQTIETSRNCLQIKPKSFKSILNGYEQAGNTEQFGSPIRTYAGSF
jgi:hypothetical protein